jgi:C4-dicarboxylate-specific signal transduction histidine kinase
VDTYETEGMICHVTRVETQADFVASLEQCGFDLILADYTLPSFDGLSALKITWEKCLGVPFIFVSGTLGEEVAIEALKIGATDYVLKAQLSRIAPSVHRALREAKERTERKRAEEALHQVQASLAHVTRVTTLGELAASIAHEINQPLAGVVTNGQACLWWLAREVPDLEEAQAAAERIIRDGQRASAVIQRIRALATKTDPHKVSLALNDVIREVVRLVYREVLGHRVALRTALEAALPLVVGDRVQLQQVLINLVINGIEAMASVTDRPCQLVIRSYQPDVD